MKYSYKLRPGYGSKKLLLDFDATKFPNKLQKKLTVMLKENGFKLENVNDLEINNEFLFEYKSTNGLITLSRDIWDFFFITGDDNQVDIIKLDKFFSKDNLFEKLEIDFSVYQ